MSNSYTVTVGLIFISTVLITLIGVTWLAILEGGRQNRLWILESFNQGVKLARG
jgi:hypothetical protein